MMATRTVVATGVVLHVAVAVAAAANLAGVVVIVAAKVIGGSGHMNGAVAQAVVVFFIALFALGHTAASAVATYPHCYRYPPCSKDDYAWMPEQNACL